MTTQRVFGHELRHEGAPHDEIGTRISSWHAGTGGEGRAKCSCGKLSDVLSSSTKRKAWHREHKSKVLAAIGDGA